MLKYVPAELFRLTFLKRCLPGLLLLGLTGLPEKVRAHATISEESIKLRAKLTLYKDSVRLAEQGKTRKETSYYLSQLGGLYLTLKQSKEGVAYFSQWIESNPDRLQSTAGAATYHSLGKLYLTMFNKKSLSLEVLHKAVSLYRKNKDRVGLANALVSEAQALQRTKKTAESLANFEEALGLAKKLKDERLQRTIYRLLGDLHKDMGHYKPSMEAMAHYTELDEKIRSSEVRAKEETMLRQTEEMRERTQEAHQLADEMEERSLNAEMEASRKDRALRSTQRTLRETQRITREHQLEIENLRKADQIKELTLREQEKSLRFERYVRYSLLGISGLVVLVLGLVYWSYWQKRKANLVLVKQKTEIQDQHDEIEQQSIALREAMHEIEKKSQNITSSIMYAQRIQQAILPDWTEMRHFFQDSFLLYRPRDIVSGDFFWFARKEGKVIIAAVDCTGHGVPGSFISMAGHTWLNHIVNERGITQADEILNHLHRDLRQALKQATTENRDGMDLALVVIDEKARTLEFAGAKNPMVLIQNGEIRVLKGDRHAIGGRQHEEERCFTRHVFTLAAPTQFYLFSDGFQDQFGGENNQKFMTKRLYNLLHEGHREPMGTQLAELEGALDGWMNGYRQIDDILVMGFRL